MNITETATVLLRGKSFAERQALMEKAEAIVDEKILKSGRRPDVDAMIAMIDEEIVALLRERPSGDTL